MLDDEAFFAELGDLIDRYHRGGGSAVDIMSVLAGSLVAFAAYHDLPRETLLGGVAASWDGLEHEKRSGCS